MRCIICDWSPTGSQSDFHKGTETYSRTRKLVIDKKTGDTICTSCATIISIDLASKEIGR